jgi:hypothetical protein
LWLEFTNLPTKIELTYLYTCSCLNSDKLDALEKIVILRVSE